MKILGADLTAAMKDRRSADPEAPDPVHIVVPDAATADVLASIADNLAGVELIRLRWARDKEMGRAGADVRRRARRRFPPALPEQARTAVSFLLEEDRARALSCGPRSSTCGRRSPATSWPAARPSTRCAWTTSSAWAGRRLPTRSTTALWPTRSRPRSTRRAPG